MTVARGQISAVGNNPGEKLMAKSFLIWLLTTLLLTTASSGAAQQPVKIPKIGWLFAAAPNTGQEAIVRMLRDLGYVDGKNISFEYRYANNKLDGLPALADELVRLKVDVLLTPGTPGALALKTATKTIPIVFFDVTDPVAAGLVDSLARPGGNITGFSSIEALLAGKRLELLKEAVPKISRVAVLWNPHDPSSVQQWKESQLPARELGLQLHSMEVTSADKFESVLKAATQVRSSALFAVSNALAASNQTRLAELAIKYRLPAIYGQASFATNGGLISYGPDPTERFRRAAVMVDKILKGTKPVDIPVEQPTKFELVINLKAAKQIGLTIPPNVLVRADRVIR
jgi:putative ABC transport system substrate-binding protein